MTNTIDHVSDLGTEVPLSQVEKELKNLFASDKAVTRASLMNFAIYSEKPDSLDENTALIREVTREHACRALLIAVSPGAEKLNVRSWITAHCNLATGGEKSICSEQITFLMEGQSAYLVPNTVLSRLDSDLPLIFWWQGQLSENFEPTLYTRIDRLIIDSGEWQNPIEQLTRLEKAYQEPGSHFNVMDLAWTRVLQLRLAMAACFDDPTALAELPRMTSVEICHSKSHGLDARMLAAWMAHQAGWEIVQAKSANHITLESKEGVAISLTFNETEGTIPVSCIRLTGPSVSCQVVREETCPFIRSIIRGPSTEIEHLSPATINTPTELILERLRRGCNNKLYFNILKILRQLIP